MMRFRTGCTIIMLFFSLAASAQSRTVRGTLQEAGSARPLRSATVTLQSLTDTLSERTTLSDSSGVFIFSALPADSFRLLVSSVGYNSVSRRITLDTADLELSIQVPLASSDLATVVISTSIAPATQRGDTVQFNASQFKVNRDADAEALVRKMPGITVENGQVTAQGEQVRRVTIDGREFFGDDATAALRNLPAEVVDKIQVFDRLSDQSRFSGFDDGNAQREINIVTKSSMRNGQFGRLYGGYGTDSRYSAGGNVTFFKGDTRISVVGQANNINQQNFAAQDLQGATGNVGGNRGGNRGGGGGGPQGGGFGGGNNNFTVGQRPGISTTEALGINFSDRWGSKVELSGSYFFNNSNNLNNQLLNREYFQVGDTSQFYRENSRSENDYRSHRVTLRMEYNLDSFNSITLTPRLRFQDTRSLRTLNSELRSPKALLSSIRSNDRISSGNFNLEGGLLYQHRFAKRGRTMSFNLDTEMDGEQRDAFLTTESLSFNGTGADADTLRQFTDEENSGRNLEFSLSYTEPVGKRGQLQFNYRPSYSRSEADQQTFQFDGGNGKYSLFDTALSNRLNNIYRRQNGGLSYRTGGRDNSFSLGLDYQQAVLQGEQVFPVVDQVDRTFRNFLPNLRWQRKLSDRTTLRLQYRTRTNAPSARQLQDVINIRNLLFPTTGNPDLRQEYSHTLFGRLNFTNPRKRTSFFANIFAQQTSDLITNAAFTIRRDSVVSPTVTIPRGARLSRPVNLDGAYNLRTFFTLSLPLNVIKSNLNFNTGVTYAKRPGLIDGVLNESNNYNYTLGAGIASNISEYVDFNVSYSANFNRIRNTIQPQLNGNYFNHVAGLQLNLTSKKGWVFNNDLTNQLFRGLATGFNQDYWLWNMAVGRKMLPDQRGELRLAVFDLLKQNQAIRRNTTEIYLEDVQNDVLQQYFMLTFIYNLRNFGRRS